jgi:hypothetical protein
MYERGEFTQGCLTSAGVLGALALLDFALGHLGGHLYPQRDAAAYLREAGYSNASYVDDKHLFAGLRGCGVDSAVGYEFYADGPTGVRGKVIVCDAPFQGAEIRQAS